MQFLCISDKPVYYSVGLCEWYSWSVCLTTTRGQWPYRLASYGKDFPADPLHFDFCCRKSADFAV